MRNLISGNRAAIIALLCAIWPACRVVCSTSLIVHLQRLEKLDYLRLLHVTERDEIVSNICCLTSVP
jgi:hypothetical protein